MINSFSKLMSKFRRDEKGVTLVEYGIALALAVLVGTTALGALAGQVNTELGQAQGIMAAN